MKDRPTPAALQYTPEQAAKALELSRTTVYALLKSGELRSHKIGRSRRIPASALVEFVEAQGQRKAS